VKPVSAKSKSKEGECKQDINSYVSMAARCKDNHTLKVWWTGLDEGARAEWYRKQQTVPFGNKRNWSDTNVIMEADRSVGTIRRGCSHFVPWWLFHDRMSKTKSLEKIQEEWDAAIKNPGVTAIWENGQWLVCQYEGVYLDDVDQRMQRRRVEQAAQVDTAEQLRDHVDALDRSLDEARLTIQAQAPLPVSLGNAPVVDCSLAEQPMLREPANIIGDAIRRNVDI